MTRNGTPSEPVFGSSEEAGFGVQRPRKGISSVKTTYPVSRLYVQVTVFRPARESEVTFMQQVMEIFGREDGWSALT